MTIRRQYLVGAGTAVTGLLGVGTNTALAQTVPKGIYFTDVNEAGEYFILAYLGDTPVDLTDYRVNFEFNGEVNQIRQFGTDAEVATGSDLTFEPGERLIVATGAKNVSDADVIFNYKGPVLNNDKSDTHAILTPDEKRVVAQSDQSPPKNARTGAATPESGTETSTEANAPTIAEGGSTRTNTDADANADAATETRDEGCS